MRLHEGPKVLDGPYSPGDDGKRCPPWSITATAMVLVHHYELVDDGPCTGSVWSRNARSIAMYFRI